MSEKTTETVEMIARAMCTVDGIDPDAQAFVAAPYMTKRGFALAHGPMCPAWHHYFTIALAARQAMAPPGSEQQEPEG